MWGVRCALDTGVALALGLTTHELEARLRTRSLAQIASECDVPMPRIRQLAWTIAEPQLAAAVAAGAIDEREREALHRRIDEKRGPVERRHVLGPGAPAASPGWLGAALAVVILVVVPPGPRARRVRGREALVELLVEPLVVLAPRAVVGHADLTYAVLTWV